MGSEMCIRDSLYIGSRENLFIYDITNDGIPERLSQTSYQLFFNTCQSDPVVANDSIAFVTLSSVEIQLGCNDFQLVDELRLYDLTNTSQPVLINSIQMSQPKGLGIDNNWLFVCDDGLKVFNVEDPLDVKQIHHFQGINTFDVIVQNGLLLVVGPENLFQFDYTVMSEMKMLSSLQL